VKSNKWQRGVSRKNHSKYCRAMYHDDEGSSSKNL